MDECSVCGNVGESNPFIKTCKRCSKVYLELGEVIKLSKKSNRLDTLRKVLVSLFADAGVYLTIEGD